MSKVVKLPVGDLMWVSIDVDGIDRGEGTNPDGTPVVKMKREAGVRFKEGSKEAKEVMSIFDAMWEEYKTSNPKIKSATEPKSLGYKVETRENEETGAKEPTGYIIVSSSTNSFFKDGKKAVVALYDEQGEVLDPDEFDIGNGTIGSIYVQPAGYEYMKSFGVTSYLKAVQIIKSTLKPSSSVVIEPEAIDTSAYEAATGETPAGV